MKYFSLNCVANAYNGFQEKLTNKSWGLLCVMKQLNDLIVPGNTYTFQSKKLSEYLESLFCLSDNNSKNNSTKDRLWYVKFSTQWYNFFSIQGANNKPNIFDAIVWAYRKEPMQDIVNTDDLVKKFAEDFHIDTSLIPVVFDTTPTTLSYDQNLYTDNALKSAIFPHGLPSTDNITAEKKSVTASVGELSRGPFIQPLYGALENSAYFLISQVDFDKMYPFGAKTTNIQIPCPKLPLQQIFYGAPGTGKSYEVKKLTKGCSVIRTTFHPDSDYASFVGTYKPSMEDVDVRVVPVVVNKGIGLQDCGTYKEKRIVYKYVKQAFLKAYLAAWKKMCRQPATPITNPIPLDNVFVITSIDDKLLWHSKTEKASKKRVSSTWQKLWNSGNFQIPKGRQSGETLEQAISNWIYSNYPNCTKNDFDKGWDLLIKEIKVKNEIETSTNKLGDKSKKFKLSPGENDDTVVYFTEGNKKDKKRIESCYNGTAKPVGVEKEIIKKLQDYHAPTFDNAWDELKKEFNNINLSTPESEDVAPDRQFLIIEEINRGNCAQIFGDIFQLLDRFDNGFSTYPIEADTDIQKAIADAFKSEPEYQLSCDINVEGAVKDYTSNYGKTLSEDIQEGRVMLLPPNLYIWATMNTSDQSLFPIDSAFKRRWEWEYMPISYKNENWIIKIGGKNYKWVDFQRTINDKIYSIDNSEDKQLGDYFVNAERTGNEISSDTLLNKILFYIWNDVCKDDPDQIFRWKDDKDNNHEKSIRFSDFFCNERDRKLQGFMSFLGIVADKTNEPESPQKPEESEASDTSAEEDNDVNS